MGRGGHERAWDEGALQAPHEQADKADRVRRMFDAIAPTYELINSVFSAGRDRQWRRRAAQRARPTADDRVLDICCGTGDFARVFQSLTSPPRRIVGCDFADGMLRVATGARSGRGDVVRPIRWIRCDALALPFRSGSFSITSCAFGVRNFQELDTGVREMHRVLGPGGRCVIVEFARPTNRVLRALYEWYTGKLMPFGASLISGDRSGAYRYLPRSVVSFSSPAELCSRLEGAGFVGVEMIPQTFGTVTIYVATKS